MITFAGIDGTSSAKGTEVHPGEYQEIFKNSFTNRLSRNEIVKFTNPWYLRGPYTDGFDTALRAELAYEHCVTQWKSGNAKAIFLAGYSRGGAAVIEVAKWLKERNNIPVECLIVFDPVDRTNTLGGVFRNTPIASTVRQVIYPQRDKNTTLSRISFQNCGYEKEDPSTPYSYRKFYATHGGLGGTPWTTAELPIGGGQNPLGTIWEFGELNPTTVTPKEDEDGSKLVWAWVLPQIVTAYYNCLARLRSEEPTKKPDFQVPDQPGKPGSIGGGGKRIHVVVQGDWLSKIAIKYYGDMNKWPTIYNQPDNKKVIGPDPNLIKPGQRLIIP